MTFNLLVKNDKKLYHITIVKRYKVNKLNSTVNNLSKAYLEFWVASSGYMRAKATVPINFHESLEDINYV